MVPLTKPPYEQEVTLQLALVDWAVKFPSIKLLFLHCMLEHDADNEAGMQYKLQEINS